MNQFQTISKIYSLKNDTMSLKIPSKNNKVPMAVSLMKCFAFFAYKLRYLQITNLHIHYTMRGYHIRLQVTWDYMLSVRLCSQVRDIVDGQGI